MISAIVHTYNEEKNIQRCLSSISWVDEIILIDMGSSDMTCKIALAYKAKIFQHPYTGFVEPARNFGLSKASGKWILVIDADEEVPKNLANLLKQEAKKSQIDFYRIPRKNIIFNKWIKHAGWWPDYQVRFFKKGSVSWIEKIHGIPVTSGKGEDIEAREEYSIVHYNYQSIEQFIQRLNRYTSISAKELYLSNEHFYKNFIFEKPVKEFINRYFVWKGYKEGLHGLCLALLQSISELIVYLKLWELEGFQEKRFTLFEIEKMIGKQVKIYNYWSVNEKIRCSSYFQKLWLKIKRRLNNYG